MVLYSRLHAVVHKINWFNSCERLLLRTLILDIRKIGIADLSFGHLSDLIQGIMENGLRHASGPVHAKHCKTNTSTL